MFSDKKINITKNDKIDHIKIKVIPKKRHTADLSATSPLLYNNNFRNNYNWWLPINNMYYSSYACPWNYYACTGRYYVQNNPFNYAPPNSIPPLAHTMSYTGGFMGKPNLYISSKIPQTFQIEVKLKNKGLMLASVPSIGMSNWKGRLQKNEIFIDKVKYDYLYYDFYFDIKLLQSKKGFCCSQKELIIRLTDILEKMKFRPKEIKDFQEYWPSKMPFAQKYCVFPQQNDDLNKIAQLNIKYSVSDIINYSLTRIAFIIIPQNKLPNKKENFLKPPSIDWKLISENNKDKQNPSVEIREWGVGFLVN